MLEEFESKIKRIFYYACRYGLDKTNSTDSDFAIKLITNCHIGFSQAQSLILTELEEITLAKRSLKARLKEANRRRDKDESNAIKRTLQIEEFKELIVRRIADSIAWQMIGGRSDVAKRLFTTEKVRPSLDESNLSSVREYVEQFNKENPLSFALISDLTSFIHIGDILTKHGDQLIISEMKDGKKNDQALDILEAELANRKEIDIEEISRGYDKYMADQLKRVYKQHVKGIRAACH